MFWVLKRLYFNSGQAFRLSELNEASSVARLRFAVVTFIAVSYTHLDVYKRQVQYLQINLKFYQILHEKLNFV